MASVTNLFDIASLAAYAYSPTPANLPADTGTGTWKPLTSDEGTLSGFYAAALQNQKTKEIVIAIRGTVLDRITWKTWSSQHSPRRY
jgi:hypothetical protein